MPWIRTYTGKEFHFNGGLDPGSIDILDIAHHTSMLCRFTGAIRQFYSVAQHAVMVSRMVMYADDRDLPELSLFMRLAALLHDGSEAYTGDANKPLKTQLPDFQRIENSIQDAIYAKYLGRIPYEHEEGYIKEADLKLLKIEAQSLLPMGLEGFDAVKDIPAPNLHITPLTPAEAEKLFLHEFRKLKGE